MALPPLARKGVSTFKACITSNGIDGAFQLDANDIATSYSVWLDKITLSYW